MDYILFRDHIFTSKDKETIALFGALFYQVLSEDEKTQCLEAQQDYMLRILQLMKSGNIEAEVHELSNNKPRDATLVKNPIQGIPFAFNPEHPPSIYYTCLVLANLLAFQSQKQLPEQQVVQLDTIIAQLLGWLLSRQDENGWFSDVEQFQKIPDLPAWQNPGNTGVKILNTAVVLAQLAVFLMTSDSPPIDKTMPEHLRSQANTAFSQAMVQMFSMKLENGTFLGFPQTTWMVTPAIASFFKLESNEFLTHLSILKQFIYGSHTQLSAIVTIAKGLIDAKIDPGEEVLSACAEMIEEFFSSGSQSISSLMLATPSSLALGCALVLEYTNRLTYPFEN